MTVDEELSALMDRFFLAVSFGAGRTPEYERLHDLFTPAGRLVNAIGDALDDTTVAEFIEPRRALVDAGVLTSFEEVETGAVTESFGKVAHRFSTYEKRGVRDGTAFAARGRIATQFVRTPGGWRITSMAWDDEAASGAEDPPDGRRADAVAEAGQLAVHPAVFPGRVLRRRAQHQVADLLTGP